MRFFILLLFIAIVSASELNKRISISLGNLGDLNTPYFWKFTVWSTNTVAGGSVSLGHHVIMAVPYLDAQGVNPVPYSLDGDIASGSTIRMDLFYNGPDNILGAFTGKIETVLTGTKNSIPISSGSTKYTLWDPGFITNGKITPNTVSNEFVKTSSGRFGTGSMYLLVGNNCQNFASSLMGQIKTDFA